jgi:hypothetical protein
MLDWMSAGTMTSFWEKWQQATPYAMASMLCTVDSCQAKQMTGLEFGPW